MSLKFKLKEKRIVFILSLSVFLLLNILPLKTDAHRDDSNQPPLLHAVRHNSIERAQLLLQYGADVNESGSGGVTALVLAIENNNIELSCI